MTETKTTKKTAKAKTTKTRAAAPRPADVVFKALGKRPQTIADLVAKTGLSDGKVRDAIRSLGHKVSREPLKAARTAPSGKGRKIHEGFVKTTYNAAVTTTDDGIDAARELTATSTRSR